MVYDVLWTDEENGAYISEHPMRNKDKLETNRLHGRDVVMSM